MFGKKPWKLIYYSTGAAILCIVKSRKNMILLGPSETETTSKSKQSLKVGKNFSYYCMACCFNQWQYDKHTRGCKIMKRWWGLSFKVAIHKWRHPFFEIFDSPLPLVTHFTKYPYGVMSPFQYPPSPVSGWRHLWIAPI